MLDVLASLLRTSEARPNDPAFSEGERTLSYVELSEHVAGLADDLVKIDSPTIAILAPNSLEWVIADLALAFAGKTMVPLPTFFSEQQLTHIVQDADVGCLLVTEATSEQASALGIPQTTVRLDGKRMPLLAEQDRSPSSGRIIYTSGTTGTPKGVRIGAEQISASTKGLLEASEASAHDRYLSVLPFSLLLEQIAGICVPLMAGAPVILAPHVAGAALQGNAMPLMEAFFTSRATTSVLVPGLLEAWVKTLAATANAAPSALRFVAVGGAPVNPAVAQQAWEIGVPVHEGYGLSECCSVVSVNRPGDREAGTTGRPIPGVYVTLEDGEIIVHAKTVMNGYLNREGEQPDGVWQTGDLGEFTDQGALRIIGRKDNLIVTQAGRNISPEWVEGQCESVRGITKAVLTQVDGEGLVLLVLAEPAPSEEDAAGRLEHQLAKLPGYAQPDRIAYIASTDVIRNDLFSQMGDVQRAACNRFAANWLRHQSAA